MWIGRNHGGLDRELKLLGTVLQRIGGDGYVALAREALLRVDAKDYICALDVGEPFVESVVEELQAIVDRFIDADPSSREHFLASYALRLLAVAGDRNRVLEAALECTGNIEFDVPALLADLPPNAKKF